MPLRFEVEDFALTFSLLSTILVLSFLGFQIMSTPRRSYIAIYAISKEGKVFTSNETILRLGDGMKFMIVVENHLGRPINAKLLTIFTGDLNFTSPEGCKGSIVNEQVFTIDDKGRSVAEMEFSVTKAIFGQNSITVEQVDVNSFNHEVMAKSPSSNQTFRLIFYLLIWSDDEGRYVTKWNDGINDHTSWLQIWFELVPEAVE